MWYFQSVNSLLFSGLTMQSSRQTISITFPNSAFGWCLIILSHPIWLSIQGFYCSIQCVLQRHTTAHDVVMQTSFFVQVPLEVVTWSHSHNISTSYFLIHFPLMCRCYLRLLYLLSYHSSWLRKDLGRIILMEELPWLWAIPSSSIWLSSSLFIWAVTSLWGTQANSSYLWPLPVNLCLLYMMQRDFPTQSFSATESFLTVSKSHHSL